MRRGARRALALVLASAFGAPFGCAAMSSGDCTDKGVCASVEATGAPDASLESDAPRALDGRVATDAVADGTVDARDASDGDAVGDALADGSVDAITDATPDVASSDATAACRDGDCVEAPPAGWSGPWALDERTGASPAACAAPYTAVAYEGSSRPSAPAAVCGCACGSAVDVTCGSPTLDLYAGASCASRCGGASIASSGCTAVSTATCGGSVYARATSAVASGGRCAPQATVAVPAWSWGSVARACALPSPATRGVCEVGRVCAPTPASPFSARLCVAIDGDAACPNGSSYSVRHLLATGGVDTRGCSSCTCSAPTGATCGGAVALYNTSSCTLPTSTLALTSACTSVQIATASATASTTAASGGACTPSSVVPTGALVPSGATTVCCMP